MIFFPTLAASLEEFQSLSISLPLLSRPKYITKQRIFFLYTRSWLLLKRWPISLTFAAESHRYTMYLYTYTWVDVMFEVLAACCQKLFFFWRWVIELKVNCRYWTAAFFLSLRFPGKTLKGKKYKPLFKYFNKVCRLIFCRLNVLLHRMKTDLLYVSL